MIELIIRGDDAAHMIREVGHLAGVMAVGQQVLAAQHRQQMQAQSGAQQSEGAADPAQPEQSNAASETAQPADTAPKRSRGRPPKSETVSTPVETAPATEKPADASDPGEVPDQFKRTVEPKSEIVVPKDLDGLRKLIQTVCSAKSPGITEVIIKKYGEKTSLIPVEKYPEVAAELHAAMAPSLA